MALWIILCVVSAIASAAFYFVLTAPERTSKDVDRILGDSQMPDYKQSVRPVEGSLKVVELFETVQKSQELVWNSRPVGITIFVQGIASQGMKASAETFTATITGFTSIASPTAGTTHQGWTKSAGSQTSPSSTAEHLAWYLVEKIGPQLLEGTRVSTRWSIRACESAAQHVAGGVSHCKRQSAARLTNA